MTARLVIALGLIAASGCAPLYVRPSAGEPHATLKLRWVHEHPTGGEMREMVDINGALAHDRASRGEAAKAPRIDVMRVRPGPAEVVMAAIFWDTRVEYDRKERRDREVIVPLARCLARHDAVFEQGHVYLVDFTHRVDSEVCSMTCVEQVRARSDGALEHRPCKTAAEASDSRGRRPEEVEPARGQGPDGRGPSGARPVDI